jgi:hypothetical protein
MQEERRSTLIHTGATNRREEKEMNKRNLANEDATWRDTEGMEYHHSTTTFESGPDHPDDYSRPQSRRLTDLSAASYTIRASQLTLDNNIIDG